MALERFGKFIAPEGTVARMPKDTLTGDALNELMTKRKVAAQIFFESADLDPVSDFGKWNEDGCFFSMPVTYDNGSTSVSGSFGVEFLPDTDKIVEWWS